MKFLSLAVLLGLGLGSSAKAESTILEGRTFCAKESIVSISHAWCVTFANGEALFTPRGGKLWHTPMLKGPYKVDGIYVTMKTYFPVLEGDLVIAGKYGLTGKAGDYPERLENPSIFYWITDPQVHYVFVDAENLIEDISINVDASEDCLPSSHSLKIKAGTQQTYKMAFGCGRGYGTVIEFGDIKNNQGAIIGDLGFSSLEGRQIICDSSDSNMCSGISYPRYPDKF